MISASSDGYFTTQKEFTYNNEQNVEIDLYMLETNLTNSYSLFVQVFDQLNYAISNTNVKLEEFDEITQSFKEVAQCTSDSNGECQFLVEVGTKKYRVTGTKTINNILYSDTTVELGEVFQPEISQGQVISTSQIVRNLYLKPSLTDVLPNLFGFAITAPEIVEETIIQQNESETIVNIPVEFNGVNNINYEVCLTYYVVQDAQKVELPNKVCEIGSSGTLTSNNFILDRQYSYIAEITVNYNEETTLYKSYKYESNNSLAFILSQTNYLSPFILLLWILILALSLHAGNISIFGYGGIILSIIQFINFPNFINLYLNIYIIMMGLAILYISRKREDIY